MCSTTDNCQYNSDNSICKKEFINDYHFPMVADEIRNTLYFSALKKVIHRNMTVLDVGAGTMLLSMMASDLGAAKVIGIESNPSMIRIAKEVLRENNFTSKLKSRKINLYEGKLYDIYLGYSFYIP